MVGDVPSGEPERIGWQALHGFNGTSVTVGETSRGGEPLLPAVVHRIGDLLRSFKLGRQRDANMKPGPGLACAKTSLVPVQSANVAPCNGCRKYRNGFVSVRMEKARKQREAVRALVQAGGGILSDCQWDSESQQYLDGVSARAGLAAEGVRRRLFCHRRLSRRQERPLPGSDQRLAGTPRAPDD